MISIGLVLGGAAAIYGAAMLAIALLQNSLIYHPQAFAPRTDPVAAGLPDFVLVASRVANGVASGPGTGALPGPADGLAAWLHPPQPGKRWLVFFHGNAGHLADRVDKYQYFADQGLGVLAPTYRYNTDSDFAIEEHILVDNARAWLRWLQETQGAAPTDVILYGESLGGALAVAVGATQNPAAVIIEASFDSMEAMAARTMRIFPTSMLLRDRWLSEDRAKRIRAPALFIHHRNDRVVPWKAGQALFAAYGGPSFTDKTMQTLPGNLHVVWPDAEPPAGLGEFLARVGSQPNR